MHSCVQEDTEFHRRPTGLDWELVGNGQCSNMSAELLFPFYYLAMYNRWTDAWLTNFEIDSAAAVLGPARYGYGSTTTSLNALILVLPKF